MHQHGSLDRPSRLADSAYQNQILLRITACDPEEEAHSGSLCSRLTARDTVEGFVTYINVTCTLEFCHFGLLALAEGFVSSFNRDFIAQYTVSAPCCASTVTV